MPGHIHAAGAHRLAAPPPRHRWDGRAARRLSVCRRGRGCHPMAARPRRYGRGCLSPTGGTIHSAAYAKRAWRASAGRTVARSCWPSPRTCRCTRGSEPGVSVRSARARPGAGRRGYVLAAGQDAIRVTFWSADWTPWRALAALAKRWPVLRFDPPDWRQRPRRHAAVVGQCPSVPRARRAPPGRPGQVGVSRQS
jgi:hypothetical protein